MSQEEPKARTELNGGLGGFPHYENGYIHNCFLMKKDDDAPYMFRISESPENYVIAFLDGYAVIPMKEYERLKALDA